MRARNGKTINPTNEMVVSIERAALSDCIFIFLSQTLWLKLIEPRSIMC
jgi:hypothetical protein